MNEYLQDILRSISKGDTNAIENFFRLPGGRKYLENITLILLQALPNHNDEKEELYLGFVEVLNHMEQRIQRQQEGKELLKTIFRNS